MTRTNDAPRAGSRRALLWVCLGAVTVGVLAGFAIWPGESAGTPRQSAGTPGQPGGAVTVEHIQVAGGGPVLAATARDEAASSTDPDDDGWAGFAVMPERPAPDFGLTAASGEAWSLGEQRGNVTILFFGYTRCPDVCPQTLVKLEKAFARLGDDSAGIQVALVTTDPEHDTPEVLAEYAAGFDLPLVGLTGAPDEVRAAGALYAAQPQIAKVHGDEGHSDAGHSVEGDLSHADHSSRVWLIDSSGQLRVTFMGPFTIDDVVRDVSRLQAERR